MPGLSDLHHSTQSETISVQLHVELELHSIHKLVSKMNGKVQWLTFFDVQIHVIHTSDILLSGRLGLFYISGPYSEQMLRT